MGIRGHPLPAEQEAQEIARRHRLDLRPQTLDGVSVDARQQPALAPFFGIRYRGEAATHGEALGFERNQRGGDVTLWQMKRARQHILRDRPKSFEAPGTMVNKL